jgi:hypothetical protein
MLLLAVHWHAHHNASTDRYAKGHRHPNTLHACRLQLRSKRERGYGSSCSSIWLCTRHVRLPWLLLLTKPCQCSSGIE